MKRNLLTIGILLLSLFYAFSQKDDNNIEKQTESRDNEVTRTVLIEGFTSSSCGPCLQGNIEVKNVLNQNHGQYALIKYQMYWPGNGDPYYTAEGGSRRLFYGVNSVPEISLNGNKTMGTGSLTNELLTNTQNIAAFIELDVLFIVTEHTVNAKVIINPTKSVTGQNLRLYVAIVEKTTYNNYTVNGEREFTQVMKKFMPDAGGVYIGDVEANVTIIKVLEHEFKGNYRLPDNALSPINHAIEHSVEDFNNLTIVAWLQDGGKVIHQACNGVVAENTDVTFGSNANGELVATVNGEPINSGQQLNSGDKILFTATPNENYKIKEWTINGEVVKNNISNELTVTVVGNKFLDVRVVFEKVSYVYIAYIAVNEFGTITATSNEETIESGGRLEKGATVVFSANPNEGYEVKEWKRNGIVDPDNNTNEFIIKNLSEDIFVTVDFIESVGIKNSLLSNIKIYPNPFTSSLTISNAQNVKSVIFTNLLGQTVKEIKSKENRDIVIDTKDLPLGVYFVNLQVSNNEKIVYKVVKKF